MKEKEQRHYKLQGIEQTPKDIRMKSEVEEVVEKEVQLQSKLEEIALDMTTVRCILNWWLRK